MAERCCVHLAPLDVNLMTDKKNCGGGATPLVHVEVYIHRKGTALSEEAETQAEGQNMTFTALLTRLYYGTASIVSEIQEGRILLEHHTHALNPRPSPAYLRLQNGERLFLLYPVEGVEYMLAITIPASLWRWMGPVALQILLATAVRGYEIPINVAAVASVPTYYPLRDRLAESVNAVENAVRMQMKQILEFVVYLNECEHHETASSTALIQGGKEAVVVTQRMCHDRPSSIRTNSRLSITLQQLLWSATSFSDYIALTGAIPSGGMSSGYKRLAIMSAAVWYHGEPLFSSGSSDDFEMYLLPAALVSYADRCLTSREVHTVQQQPITVNCLAMYKHTYQEESCAAGYVKKREDAKENNAAVTIAFVSSRGWIIALRMEPALNAFTGAPMTHIVSGVTDLISRTLETPKFISLVQSLTAAGQLIGQSSIISSAALTSSAVCILRSMRRMGLFAHSSGDASSTASLARGVCLYCYEQTATHAVGRDGCWTRWPNHMRRAVEHSVDLTTVAFQYCRQKTRGNISQFAPFSLLRGENSVVFMLATPVCKPIPKIIFFLAELNPKGVPAAAELRAFATWVLSKVV